MTKLEKSYWECDWIQLHSRCIFPVKPRTAHCLTCSLDPESWVHQPAKTGLLQMTDLPEWVTKFLSAERRTFSAAYTSTDINCFSNSLSAFQELIIFLHSGIRSHLPFVSLQASRKCGFQRKAKMSGTVSIYLIIHSSDICSEASMHPALEAKVRKIKLRCFQETTAR